MKAHEHFLQSHQLPALEATSPDQAILLAGGVEAALLLDKGKASAEMARLVGVAIRDGQASATCEEKQAKAGMAWQEARARYDQAMAGLAVVKAYAMAARLQAGGPIHAEG